MAQETNIEIQISDDGANWTQLALLNPDTLSYVHTGVADAATKYYRLIAKGDGVNTLDSPPSQVVSITTGYSTEYQAVLDYAAANSIATPSRSQNIINDVVLTRLKWEGVWQNLDLFYFFKQEAGLQAFAELNWKSPGNFTLYNDDASLVPTFTPGSGVEHNADGKFYKTGWIPATHAVHAGVGSNGASAMLKIYGMPTASAGQQRIFGGRSASGNNQILVMGTADGSMLKRIFHNSPTPYTYDQTTINSHFYMSNEDGSDYVLKNNAVDQDISTVNGGLASGNTAELCLLGHNENGTFYGNGTGGLEYFGFGGDLRKNSKQIYKIQSGNYFKYKVNHEGIVAVSIGTDISISTVYWLTVYKTSLHPSVVCDTPYFCLYSTNHASSANGRIMWAKINSPRLDGFVEQGIIFSDNQIETPCLLEVPDDPDGHTLHLYCHTDAADPDNEGYQQTKLFTSTGGVLHQATWTNRDNVLGMVGAGTTETHTGYANVVNKGSGNMVAVHATVKAGVTPSTYGKSTSSDYGRTYTRVTSDYDRTSFLSDGRQYLADPTTFFERNGQQYAIAGNTRYDFVANQADSKISIFKCTDELPTELLANISLPNSGDAFYAMSAYVEGDVAYIYYLESEFGPEIFYTTFNLTFLD